MFEIHPNYPRMVRDAIHHFSDELCQLERRYLKGKACRLARGWPTLCIVGAGESGKDEVAKILVRRCGLAYAGGTSRIMAPMIARSLGVPVEVAYADRRHNREFWFRWMSEFRKNDPSRVARMQLAGSDFCVGIRGEQELRTAVGERVVDLPIWVEREGRQDGAHEISPELVWKLEGEIVDNNGSLHELECNVVALAKRDGLFVNDNWLYEVNCGQEKKEEAAAREPA
jgi:hypothetical protein